MHKPETLQEYLQRVNLQRRKQFFMLNEGKNALNPISLETDNKIDHMIGEILKYIKHLVGEGPLFTKFQLMMDALHKTFRRQMSQFHHISVSAKINNDKKYIDEVKKANLELNKYLLKCQQDKEEASAKLDKLMAYQKTNKIVKFDDESPKPPMIARNRKTDGNDDFEDDLLNENAVNAKTMKKVELNFPTMGDLRRKPEQKKQTMLDSFFPK